MNRYGCQECGLIFNDRKKLGDHLAGVHGREFNPALKHGGAILNEQDLRSAVADVLKSLTGGAVAVPTQPATPVQPPVAPAAAPVAPAPQVQIIPVSVPSTGPAPITEETGKQLCVGMNCVRDAVEKLVQQTTARERAATRDKQMAEVEGRRRAKQAEDPFAPKPRVPVRVRPTAVAHEHHPQVNSKVVLERMVRCKGCRPLMANTVKEHLGDLFPGMELKEVVKDGGLPSVAQAAARTGKAPEAVTGVAAAGNEAQAVQGPGSATESVQREGGGGTTAAPEGVSRGVVGDGERVADVDRGEVGVGTVAEEDGGSSGGDAAGSPDGTGGEADGEPSKQPAVVLDLGRPADIVIDIGRGAAPAAGTAAVAATIELAAPASPASAPAAGAGPAAVQQHGLPVVQRRDIRGA